MRVFLLDVINEPGEFVHEGVGGFLVIVIDLVPIFIGHVFLGELLVLVVELLDSITGFPVFLGSSAEFVDAFFMLIVELLEFSGVVFHEPFQGFSGVFHEFFGLFFVMLLNPVDEIRECFAEGLDGSSVLLLESLDISVHFVKLGPVLLLGNLGEGLSLGRLVEIFEILASLSVLFAEFADLLLMILEVLLDLFGMVLDELCHGFLGVLLELFD